MNLDPNDFDAHGSAFDEDEDNVAPLPPETPAEKKTRTIRTRWHIGATIAAAGLMIYWQLAQEAHGAYSFTPVIAFPLIPLSFFAWIRQLDASLKFRFAQWVWVSAIFLPSIFQWLFHGMPLLGSTAQWAAELYCMIATYFFARIVAWFWDAF